MELSVKGIVRRFGQVVALGGVDLDVAPDGDIGPMVPPPSAPAPKRGANRLPQAR